jgi:hypothetical protein
VILVGCAGRDPRPIAIAQPVDGHVDCRAIIAEQYANALQIHNLGIERQQTQANNTTAGVVGMVLFWPALFAMDMKGAAGTEIMALESRNAYLATLAAQRRCIA